MNTLKKELKILKKNKNKNKHLIILIYCVLFLFFGFKMVFYTNFVGRFPDEIQHISYIAYLEKNNVVIPKFKEMRSLEKTNAESDDGVIELKKSKNSDEYLFGDNQNYLGHPPLYYHIMRLSGAINVKDNVITFDLLKLRYFNIALSALGIIIVLYIGYSRVGKNPLLHLLYGTIAVSVPMLAYCSAGINNDTLALIGLSTFILGLLRFSENKRNFFTYLILSLGIFLAFFTKLTTGLIVLIAMIIYIILIIKKEKNLWFLTSKQFLATIPIYLTIPIYYMLVYRQTGSIMPTFGLLDPVGYHNSGLYVAVSDRTHMSFIKYTVYFIRRFLQTWTGIASQIYLVKIGNNLSIATIGLVGLLGLPILLLIKMKKYVEKAPIILAIISVYFGLAISAMIQWLRAYNEFAHISGYLGGFQSRYYLCGISILGLAVTFICKNIFEDLEDNKYAELSKLELKNYPKKFFIINKKTVLQIACFIYIALLIYEDFIYFVLYYKDYL